MVNITVNPPEWTWAPQILKVGSPYFKTFKFTNNDSETAYVRLFDLTTPFAGTNALEITPNKSESASIEFKPQQAGNISIDMNIPVGDPVQGTLSIPVSGLVANSQLGAFPQSMDFGDVPRFSGKRMIATIHNAGVVTLQISDLAVTHDLGFGFIVLNSLLVPVDGSLELDVEFAPFAEGDASATISFKTDDPNNPTVHIALTGIGTAPLGPIHPPFL
jgi:hypothetical protein